MSWCHLFLAPRDWLRKSLIEGKCRDYLPVGLRMMSRSILVCLAWFLDDFFFLILMAVQVLLSMEVIVCVFPKKFDVHPVSWSKRMARLISWLRLCFFYLLPICFKYASQFLYIASHRHQFVHLNSHKIHLIQEQNI